MNKPLIAILITFIILSMAWNIFTPPYENLDEIEHAEVIRHIAVTGHLPAHGEAEAAGYHVRQEASQPPLYYLLGAVWLKALNLPTIPPEAQTIPSQVVSCGDSGTFYNKATWARDPYNDFPLWDGNIRTVHGLRLFSMLLQLLTLIGTWKLSRRLFPQGSVPILATAIVAFNPQFTLVASGVNNDNLVTPIATWALLLLIDIWQKGPTAKKLLGYGLLSGLAAMSKLSGAALLGLAGLVLIIYAVKKHTPVTQVILWGGLMGLPALVISAPWVLRNLQLYGDPTGLAPMLEHVGTREQPVDMTGTFRLMYFSYWGQLPCSFYPRALYWPFLLLSGGGIAFAIMRWKQFSRIQKDGALILCCWFIVIVAAWIRWNAITPATGGRLLFPAAPAMAILIASGWSILKKSPVDLTRLWAAFLPLWCLIVLRAGLMPLFAPSPLLSPTTEIPNPVNYTFGSSVQLKGYQAHIVKPELSCWLVHQGYCDPALDITLYWKAKEHVAEDLTFALQFVSSVPGENKLRLNYSHWPGHGNFPTSTWPVDQVIADHYLLPLPPNNSPTQAWDLQVILLSTETGKRLPVYSEENHIGNAANLMPMRLPGSTPSFCSSESILTEPIRFGDAIALTHATAHETSDGWEVALCWESLVTVSKNYTVFAHAVAEDGTLLGTGDGPPMHQGFPTSLWEPGDEIADTHIISLSEVKEVDQIVVGIYNPETGERLSATTDSGSCCPDNAVSIWKSIP